MSKITVINASPRLNWNTAQLLGEAARGAESAGAEIKSFNLYKLEKYTGCISCFGCKTAGHFGECICRDGLKPVLDEIRSSDGLIIGTPNYLGDVSAVFRALYERLIFQYLSYKKERPSYNTKPIPVLFIMTSNCPEENYGLYGYDKMLENYRANLSRFIGPTKTVIVGNTVQVSDYSKYNWTVFDHKSKIKQHEEEFASQLEKAYSLGKSIVTAPWND